MDYKKALSELDELKNVALAELNKVSTPEDATPEQKFESALGLLGFEYKKQTIEQALSAINEVQEPIQKQEMLMRLINEIEFLQDNFSEAQNPPTPAPQS
ncbi:MAG: hypothetical protein LBQ02_02875 [Candidatus Nomurabacteria bacterium]|jgi:Holliday junction resolvasome RuvABC DNA-binding subunit|nr:hypothetical protein [Candidatus Nomurabacteria bacterium]